MDRSRPTDHAPPFLRRCPPVQKPPPQLRTCSCLALTLILACTVRLLVGFSCGHVQGGMGVYGTVRSLHLSPATGLPGGCYGCHGCLHYYAWASWCLVADQQLGDELGVVADEETFLAVWPDGHNDHRSVLHSPPIQRWWWCCYCCYCCCCCCCCSFCWWWCCCCFCCWCWCWCWCCCSRCCRCCRCCR